MIDPLDDEPFEDDGAYAHDEGMEWALKEGAGKWKDGGDSMAGAMAGM